jgi:hypothetical protein
MSAPGSRRGFLRGLATLPLVGSAAVASKPAVSAEERQLLAVGPRLVRLLDEYDQLWGPHRPFYEAWEAACERLPANSSIADRQAIPEWATYIAARRPADEIGEELEALFEPFNDVPLTTFEGILLRHRYGMTFGAWREDALEDLDRIWRGDKGCA